MTAWTRPLEAEYDPEAGWLHGKLMPNDYCDTVDCFWHVPVVSEIPAKLFNEAGAAIVL